jgi:gliding motility-associated-like protein
MKKFLPLFTLLLLLNTDLTASHTKGGWMYYEYLGQGIADPAKLRYKVVLNLYMICNPSSGQLDDPINFSIFDAGTNAFILNSSVSISANNNTQNCTLQSCHECISPIPSICYKVVTYEKEIELNPNINGYVISWQRCCRIIGLSNISSPSNSSGATYTITIPGSATGNFAQQNSSPRFNFNDTAIVCNNSPFSVDFGAVDPNADSLVYSFCNAFNGGSQSSPVPGTATAPPYSAVSYSAGFSGFFPLGSNVEIDPQTGIVSGIAPASGEYVVTVCVAEYRGGIFIGQARKELHLKVADCSVVKATLNPSYITCDGFSLSFTNNGGGNINSYFWDFGVAGTLDDTSNLANPTFTFPDTGQYLIKLVVNRGSPCGDSTTAIANVYPGFFAGFVHTTPVCINVPVNFTDTSRTIYGVVNRWRWDFGNPATLADTSRLQNPTYTYTAAGVYTVTLVVNNSKGCTKTITQDLTVSTPPPINMLFRDSTYCALDSIQLNASGSGSFSWTPNNFILNANTATPTVFPPVPTRYYVTLNANGCISRDSVNVNPVNNLTASVTGPGSICEEDTVLLSGSSNRSNVTWQWNNPGTLSAPNAQQTNAFPITTTNYLLTVRWGRNCIATAPKTISVTPLAIPVVSPGASLCKGSPGVPISASGGNTYTWTPATGLSAANIANPIARPDTTTTYVVKVGVTGCSKLRDDSVTVTVRPLPLLTLINDTLICSIDTLQLTTTGTGSFSWTPNYNISSITGGSPLVSPDVPTWYYTTLTDGFGCQSKDSVKVDVKLFVTLDAGNDTTICRTDGFNINTVSDALSYKWTPSTYLDRDDVKRPFATPLSTTKYYVTANIGKCQSNDSVTIRIVPYPNARAGNDTLLCPGTSGQLFATGGSSYFWSPTTFLSSNTIADPRVITPTGGIRYIVTVTDTLGCPKPVRDTVWVRLHPRVFANAGPRDTTIVLGEPLQLNATGGDQYVWEPGDWLTSTIVANPVALPQSNIEYHLLATSNAGCEGRDSIRIKLYQVEASMYVPTAFTPNIDRLNDVLRPILLGMKSLSYFRVYNRWGQLLFSTTEKGKGWDGTFSGTPQPADTYVWMAEGVDYKNAVIRKKGYAVLIR